MRISFEARNAVGGLPVVCRESGQIVIAALEREQGFGFRAVGKNRIVGAVVADKRERRNGKAVFEIEFGVGFAGKRAYAARGYAVVFNINEAVFEAAVSYARESARPVASAVSLADEERVFNQAVNSYAEQAGVSARKRSVNETYVSYNRFRAYNTEHPLFAAVRYVGYYVSATVEYTYKSVIVGTVYKTLHSGKMSAFKVDVVFEYKISVVALFIAAEVCHGAVIFKSGKFCCGGNCFGYSRNVNRICQIFEIYGNRFVAVSSGGKGYNIVGSSGKFDCFAVQGYAFNFARGFVKQFVYVEHDIAG